MKKTMLLLGVLLALFFTGCGKDIEPTVETISREDRGGQEPDYAAYCKGAFVETAAGYYYAYWSRIQEDGNNVQLIYFCPRDGVEFRPLCGKPNCMHADSNCNAWSDLMIAYANEKIYTTESNPSIIYNLNPDGTDRQVAMKVDPRAFQNGASMMMLPGKYTVIPNSLPEAQQEILIVDFADNSQKWLALPGLEGVMVCGPLACDQDRIILEGSAKGSNYSFEGMRLIEMDLHTGEMRTVISGYYDGASVYLTDTTLYFYVGDEKTIQEAYGVEYHNVEEPGFREYDLKTGSLKNCGMAPGDGNSCCFRCRMPPRVQSRRGRHPLSAQSSRHTPWWCW